MRYLKGSLLVASPHLPDPNFYRTVVLMVEHTEEGAFGLVLNRVCDARLDDVWNSVGGTRCHSDQFLRVGGPVEGPLMALHTLTNLEGIEVIPKVYFSSQKSDLEFLVEHPEPPFHMFSGYAGWGPHQLEEEMQRGGWLTTPAHWEHVFARDDDDELWRRVTHEIGAEITNQTLKIRHAPIDPRNN